MSVMQFPLIVTFQRDDGRRLTIVFDNEDIEEAKGMFDEFSYDLANNPDDDRFTFPYAASVKTEIPGIAAYLREVDDWYDAFEDVLTPLAGFVADDKEVVYASLETYGVEQGVVMAQKAVEVDREELLACMQVFGKRDGLKIATDYSYNYLHGVTSYEELGRLFVTENGFPENADEYGGADEKAFNYAKYAEDEAEDVYGGFATTGFVYKL